MTRLQHAILTMALLSNITNVESTGSDDIIGVPFPEESLEGKEGDFENEDDKDDAQIHDNIWGGTRFLQEEMEQMEISCDPPNVLPL